MGKPVTPPNLKSSMRLFHTGPSRQDIGNFISENPAIFATILHTDGRCLAPDSNSRGVVVLLSISNASQSDFFFIDERIDPTS